MLTVPPVLLDVLQLTAGSKVGLTVENGCLVVETSLRPRYTMAELLAESDYTKPQSADDREWIDSPAVGGEFI